MRAPSASLACSSPTALSEPDYVVANRAEYAAKFHALQPRLASALPCTMPDAAFYLWAAVPGDDVEFARRLYETQNVTVVPGSFLAREAAGGNPGKGRIRIALVAPMAVAAP